MIYSTHFLKFIYIFSGFKQCSFNNIQKPQDLATRVYKGADLKPFGSVDECIKSRQKHIFREKYACEDKLFFSNRSVFNI